MSRDPAEKYLLTRLGPQRSSRLPAQRLHHLDESGKSLVPYFLDHGGDPMDLAVFWVLPGEHVTGHPVP